MDNSPQNAAPSILPKVFICLLIALPGILLLDALQGRTALGPSAWPDYGVQPGSNCLENLRDRHDPNGQRPDSLQGTYG